MGPKKPLGQSFDQVIEKAITDAQCVIVLWSAASVASEWVRNEASEGKRRGILVPAFLEAVHAPLAFRLLNGANLIGWEPNAANIEFDKLIERLSEILAPTGGQVTARVQNTPHTTAAPTKPLVSTRLRLGRRVAIGTSILAVLLAITVYFLKPHHNDSSGVKVPAKETSAVHESPRRTPPESPDFGPISDLASALQSPTGTGPMSRQLPLRAFHVPGLGVHLAFVPPEQSQTTGGVLPVGAIVWKVEAGPGRDAGLHTLDVISAINDQPIENVDQLRQAIKTMGPGTHRFLIRRGAQEVTVEMICETCEPG